MILAVVSDSPYFTFYLVGKVLAAIGVIYILTRKKKQ